LDFNGLDFSSIHDLLTKDQFTCRQLTEHFLKKINEGNHLNAFISILGDRALAKAKVVDEKLKQSRAGKLAGLIVAIKDNINIKGEKTTCGSKILSNFVSPYNATVIQRLEDADAIIIGKTNMDEFAMGSSNENSFFGAVKNPLDLSRVPGGSSGGSAASVSAKLAMAALGSDTGGSVRQPASFCGVVGLKPTYGRVSRFGLVAFASSLDQIGPITQSVSDCAKILEVIAGHDSMDSTSADFAVPEYSRSCNLPIAGLKIGIPVEYFSIGLDPEIKNQIDKYCQHLTGLGAKTVEVSLPHTEYAVATYYILATAESSSNLARYDGARYGYRAESTTSLEEMYVNSRSEGFGGEVKRRIMLGAYVLSAGYYEAYYQKAQKARTLIKQDFDNAFNNCDCILTPTSPTTAFKIGEKLDDPLTMYLSDIYTVSANLAGIPAISIPFGCDSQHLPIGIQILAKPFDEETIFRVGYAIEQALKYKQI
jgi:aspartyl-tRNA(Asn)/glutamyl-tRNA(Gln) amidotransferase subunit A